MAPLPPPAGPILSLSLFLFLFTAAAASSAAACEEEKFTEELLLRPLPDRKALAHFYFRSSAPPAASVGRHHHLFPMAISQQGFLHIDEYPPDANQGFDISSALVSFPEFGSARSYPEIDPVLGFPLLENFQEDSVVKSYTEVLLVPLTTPDFSMPYNVITFTCTVLALYFGSLLNALRRRIGKEERELNKTATRHGLIPRLLAKGAEGGSNCDSRASILSGRYRPACPHALRHTWCPRPRLVPRAAATVYLPVDRGRPRAPFRRRASHQRASIGGQQGDKHMLQPYV